MKSSIITVDGPAASGKTELCRRLASRLTQWDWLSTGVFYRGLAYILIETKVTTIPQWIDCVNQSNWEIKKHQKQTQFFYNNMDITSSIYNLEIDQKASLIATCKEVRTALIQKQREQKAFNRGLIAEGRDCGTAIFPDAPLKIYLNADLEVRAKRRAIERNEQEKAVVDAQQKRDKSDSERAFNPLKQPEDAWLIQTDSYSIQEVESMVCKKVAQIFKLSLRGS